MNRFFLALILPTPLLAQVPPSRQLQRAHTLRLSKRATICAWPNPAMTTLHGTRTLDRPATGNSKTAAMHRQARVHEPAQ